MKGEDTAGRDLDIQQARIDLAAAFRLAARLNANEGVANHFSFAVSDERFLLNPRGLHFTEISASRLVVVDIEGNKVEGEGEVRPVAFYIHSRIHRARASARCILHAHPPYATALSLLAEPRESFAHQIMIRFHNQIVFDDIFNGYVLDETEGDRIVDVLGDRSILVMANHGVTVVGASVAEAYDQLYFFERMCMYEMLARGAGRPLVSIPREILDRDAVPLGHPSLEVKQHFAAMKRLLDRQEPDYRA
jgi:ribulose-5-phosphate 4-epimerase/fuculose-1-phosphate aldolase